jgi:hypothetical protein
MISEAAIEIEDVPLVDTIGFADELFAAIMETSKETVNQMTEDLTKMLQHQSQRFTHPRLFKRVLLLVEALDHCSKLSMDCLLPDKADGELRMAASAEVEDRQPVTAIITACCDHLARALCVLSTMPDFSSYFTVRDPSLTSLGIKEPGEGATDRSKNARLATSEAGTKAEKACKHRDSADVSFSMELVHLDENRDSTENRETTDTNGVAENEQTSQLNQNPEGENTGVIEETIDKQILNDEENMYFLSRVFSWLKHKGPVESTTHSACIVLGNIVKSSDTLCERMVYSDWKLHVQAAAIINDEQKSTVVRIAAIEMLEKLAMARQREALQREDYKSALIQGNFLQVCAHLFNRPSRTRLEEPCLRTMGLNLLIHIMRGSQQLAFDFVGFPTDLPRKAISLDQVKLDSLVRRTVLLLQDEPWIASQVERVAFLTGLMARTFLIPDIDQSHSSRPFVALVQTKDVLKPLVMTLRFQLAAAQDDASTIFDLSAVQHVLWTLGVICKDTVGAEIAFADLDAAEFQQMAEAFISKPDSASVVLSQAQEIANGLKHFEVRNLPAASKVSVTNFWTRRTHGQDR